jgi:hypothetical protein
MTGNHATMCDNDVLSVPAVTFFLTRMFGFDITGNRPCERIRSLPGGDRLILSAPKPILTEGGD